MGDRGEAAEMKALINLECIGDGGSRGSRADYWVAEVIGLSPHFGVKRQFLGCHKDYSRANSVGSRSVVSLSVVWRCVAAMPYLALRLACRISGG